VKQTPILVVVAAVAVGVLAWSRFSSDSWVPLDGSSGDSAVSELGDERGFDGASDLGPGTGRGRGKGSEMGGGGSPFREKRVGRDLGGSRGERGSGGTGSAATYSSGSREHGGKVGVSGSVRSGGSGSGASIAGGSGGSGGVGGRELANSRPIDSDVRDFLAQQQPPSRRGGDAADDNEDGDQNSDVVFNAPLNKETGADTTQGPPPLVQQDLQNTQDGDGLKFTKDSVLAFPDAGNLQNQAGTITFEFEPDWEGGSEGDYNFVNVRTPNDPRNLLRIYKNGRYLRFLFADETGRERNIGYDMVDMEPGGRHRVTATYSYGDSGGQTAFYIDGQLVGTNTFDGPLQIPPGTPMYVGSDVPQAGPSGAGATMSNLQIYGRALAVDEVSSLPIGSQQ
jgi:hypothetical protein